jgi:hypothetical protein
MVPVSFYIDYLFQKVTQRSPAKPHNLFEEEERPSSSFKHWSTKIKERKNLPS